MPTFIISHRSIYLNYYYFGESFSISPWCNFNTMNPRFAPSIDRKPASLRPVAHFGSLGLIICPVSRPGETCTHAHTRFLFLALVSSWQQEKIQQDFLEKEARSSIESRDRCFQSLLSNERFNAEVSKVIAANDSIRVSFAFLRVSL